MILSDLTIQSYCENLKMVTPFNRSQLNPASYDIRLGKTYIDKSDAGEVLTLFDNDCIILKPNSLILASSIEEFNLPNDISAQLSIKSSLARQGVTHMMAGWCDPGWHDSVITLELINLSDTPIKLFYKDRIAQMIFMKLDYPAYKPYAGKYNFDKTVSDAKPDIEAEAI